MSGAISGSPGITLTPEETRLFGQLFSQHDSEGSGIILGDTARPLFERSGLPAKTLGQIWQLADVENRGFLDQIGFSKALRMIYHVQHGKLLGPRLMTIPSGLPSFDHSPAPVETAATVPSQPELAASSVAAPPAPASVASPVSSTRIPPLSTSDKQKFGSLFDRSTNGPTIDGNAAKDIFLKAHLSPEVLGKVWNLVDVQSRGSLTRNEFVLAMHLIQALISRTISDVPASLPSGWIPWLEGGSTHGARGSVSSVGSTASNAAPGPINWTISSSQLAQYKKYFDSLDTQKKGVLGGSETVPFLTQSKLGEEILAQVWDLADLQGQGQFTPVEFSIAMYLIQAKLAGHELPEILPPSLLASAKGSSSRVISPVSSPSPKLQPVGASRPAPPTARIPSRTTTASSLNDLVSLDDYFKPMEPTQAPASAQTTGMAQVQRPGYTGPGLPASKEISSPDGAPLTSPGAAIATAATAAAATTFVPSSSFGQKLFNHAPATNNARAVDDAQAAVAKLNSDVSEVQTKLTQISAESKAADEQLSAITSQKQKLEEQITVLRQSYDSEASKVHQTQQELRKTQEAIQQLEKDQKLRESGLQALKSQYEADNTKLTEAKAQHESLLARISELEEQHTTHKTSLENLTAESEKIRGQTESHNQRIAAMELQLQKTLDAIESAKLVREDAVGKVQAAEQRAQRLETEVAATQEQHRSLVAETEQLLATAAAHAKRAATAEQTLSETHAAIASERARQSIVPQIDQQSSIPAVAASAIGGVVTGAVAAVAAGAAGASGNSSPVSTHQTQPTDTPHSSPPNSDYTGYPAEASNIPSFTLPMARPQSATSSVVNNPPLSVRGDLDVSQPQSPDFATSEPVSGLVPPENLKLSDVGREVDDTDSFEFVDAREGREEGKFTSPGTLTQEGIPATDFVPIQQLSLSESAETTDLASEPLAQPAEPTVPVEPVADTTGTPSATTSSVDQTKRGDDFADAFDDLEEAVEDAEEDDFSGFGNASAQSTPNPTAAGPDEWQKLFEDASAAIPGASGPHEDAILELTSMGFDRQEVLAALERTEYNVSEATNILLDQE